MPAESARKLSRGLLGGKERCEAKVRQMVADNEDGETQGGGEAGWTPAGISTETRSQLGGQRCEQEGRSGTAASL